MDKDRIPNLRSQQEPEAEGMHSRDMDELFRFAEDPDFQRACENGQIEFAQAVHDISTSPLKTDRALSGTMRPAQLAGDNPSGLADDQIAVTGTQEVPPQRAAAISTADGERGRARVAFAKAARVSGTQRDKLATDLKKKYEKGASIRALAEQTGRSYGFVHRVLSETGVTLRGRGGTVRTKKK